MWFFYTFFYTISHSCLTMRTEKIHECNESVQVAQKFSRLHQLLHSICVSFFISSGDMLNDKRNSFFRETYRRHVYNLMNTIFKILFHLMVRSCVYNINIKFLLLSFAKMGDFYLFFLSNNSSYCIFHFLNEKFKSFKGNKRVYSKLIFYVSSCIRNNHTKIIPYSLLKNKNSLLLKGIFVISSSVLDI